MVENLTLESFSEKVFDFKLKKDWDYSGDLPCVIDFYADWCGPCKMVAPTLESLSEKYAGKLHVYKVNTEEQPEIASAFGISSIPSFLFVPQEGNPQMAVGALPKQSFEQAFEEILNVKTEAKKTQSCCG